MKKIIAIISLSVIVGCKNDNNSETQVQQDKIESKVVLEENKSKKTMNLPKYKTIKEMLLDAHDFSEDNNTLKFISTNKKAFHVQVSKPILHEDLESVKEEIVKRDIVYIAFQAFAQTDINEITVTSVPVEYQNYQKYVEKYKLTVKIDREKAKSILKKYLQSEDFTILYEESNDMWLPSKNFSVLKFDKLNEVFNDISN